MTARKPNTNFQLGDVVTLKGQTQRFTVCPQPDGTISKDGWVWTTRSFDNMAPGFYLLPIVALAGA